MVFNTEAPIAVLTPQKISPAPSNDTAMINIIFVNFFMLPPHFLSSFQTVFYTNR
jgi:hypothetical protein